MGYLLFGTLYVFVYLATAVGLGRWPEVRTIVSDGLLSALAVAVCVVIFRRRREWQGAQRLFWDAFAVSQVLWVIGELGFMYGEIVEGRPSWVRWHTMFSLCGGIGPMIAVLARPDRGVRKEAAGAVGVDLAGYGLLAAFIYAYFVMVPSLVPQSAAQLEGVLLALVQIHRLLLVGGFATVAWLASDERWRGVYLRILAGTSAGFLLRLLTNRAIAAGEYHSGSIYDLAWIVPFLAYLWAAGEAPASPPASDQIDRQEPAPSAVLSAVPVLLIPLAGYGLLRLAPLGDAGDSFRVLLTTMATVAGLGLLTLRLTVESGEHHRADERLKLLAAAVEQTGDLILITTATGRIEHANVAAVRALGYPRDRLYTMALAEVLDDSQRAMVNDIGAHVRAHGIWRGTLQHRRADARTFPASSTVVALRDTHGRVTHFVGVQRDITEELRLRDQLVHSERMSAVGELVAGVAHEINNPLQTIVGCTELLLEDAGDDGQLRDLRLVRQEAARAGQIVRNLLAFVRRGSPDRAVIDLNDVVRATASLREFHLVQRGVQLRLELSPAPLPVFANRDELQQIIVNLLLNAEHALESAAQQHGLITMRTRSEGGRHMVQITDNGPGINPELKGRVFEPFFTTKEVGEGTGLGLSISLGIARAHGGSLELCDPVSGQGACFRLVLPAHESVATTAAATAPAADAAPSGGALVVDDEPAVRQLLVRLLQRRGFAVTQAASRADASAACANGTFDVVLCDLRLGDGAGEAVVRDLRQVRPELARRVIFVTGDASALVTAPDVSDVPVLAKPFTSADLDRALTALGVEVPTGAVGLRSAGL